MAIIFPCHGYFIVAFSSPFRKGDFSSMKTCPPLYMDCKEAVDLESKGNDTMARLAVCAVIAVGVVYGAEKLCQGKGYPLWEKYGPWLMENKVEAIAVIAAALYVLSLALWPEGLPQCAPEEEVSYTPCP